MLRLLLPASLAAAPSHRTPTQSSRSASSFLCHNLLAYSQPAMGLGSSALRCSLPGKSSSPTAENGEDDRDGHDEELGMLLALLPEGMRGRLVAHPERRNLVEVVMDLGRCPLARFPSGDAVLSDQPITFGDIRYATSLVGEFSADNRAGISRTLHRISAIRNRKGAIVGLTCRVGRAVSGSANLLRDLVQDGVSLLLIGPPGVGKTTIIREIGRMLADDFKKRVMIVDTSNEIGGDGDIPHAGIGSARRLQVPNPEMQHKVLIEAVENHMPQVIVIDEIGTKLEAVAASTIAQRGIQLVATAHGVTIENLTMNPSLEMLVGGIQSVTLGDDEASRRGVQKTVLERKGPSTFTCGVEIVSKTELRVHRNLEATVDALLSGRSPIFEVRKMNSQAFVDENTPLRCCSLIDAISQQSGEIIVQEQLEKGEKITNDEYSSKIEGSICLYIYRILEISVVQAIMQLRLNEVIKLTDNISEADAFLALHSKLKKNSWIQAVAKAHDIPIYVTKSSSLLQITQALRALVVGHGKASQYMQSEDETKASEKADALEEARLAIEQVVIPKGVPVELLPRSAQIISAQMDFIQRYKLKSEKIGEEPNIRLFILPLHEEVTSPKLRSGLEELESPNDVGGFCNGTLRLPFLPE